MKKQHSMEGKVLTLLIHTHTHTHVHMSIYHIGWQRHTGHECVVSAGNDSLDLHDVNPDQFQAAVSVWLTPLMAGCEHRPVHLLGRRFRCRPLGGVFQQWGSSCGGVFTTPPEGSVTRRGIWAWRQLPVGSPGHVHVDLRQTLRQVAVALHLREPGQTGTTRKDAETHTLTHTHFHAPACKIHVDLLCTERWVWINSILLC